MWVFTPEEVQKVIKETKRTQSNKKNQNLSSYANALDDHINIILSQNFINKNNIASKSIGCCWRY